MTGDGRRRVLIVPPGPEGGVGDAAVVQMLASAVRDAGVSDVGVLTYAADEDWGLGALPRPPDFVVAPSWPFDRARWSTATIQEAFREYDDVLVAGNDCIDGGYSNEGSLALLDCARFAYEHGARVSLVNCSFNQHPTAPVVAGLRALPPSIRIWLRDAISARSFRAATSRPAFLGAEIAFLVEPSAADDSVPLAWVRRHAAAGDHVVALVPNPMVGTADPLGAPQRDPGPYVAIIERLLRAAGRATRVLVIPNDARPGVGDLELAAAIASALSAAWRDAVLVSPRPLPARVLTETLGHVALLIGARFHALVMALIAGTPVVALEYQDKMRGVLRECGLEALWVPCERGLDVERVVARADATLAQAAALRAGIARAVPAMRRRARAMIADVLAGSGAPFSSPLHEIASMVIEIPRS
ncbi:MAG: polysaccharide pyruvyl transferase family protein [Deltaproteobacteria bacterium]|nr:polysaccharide pyruvyl transferase family protein [Deltaproteobacteria bacterium]